MTVVSEFRGLSPSKFRLLHRGKPSPAGAVDRSLAIIMAMPQATSKLASGVGVLGMATVIVIHTAVYIAEKGRYKPDKGADEVSLMSRSRCNQ